MVTVLTMKGDAELLSVAIIKQGKELSSKLINFNENTNSEQ